MERFHFLTHSAKETQAVACALAEAISETKNPFRGALAITLSGELGAGKTTFAQGLAKGFHVRKKVLSPTFILMRTYTTKKNAWKTFVHIDGYRLKKHDARRALPMSTILADTSAVVLIEWPERFGRALPTKRIAVTLCHRKPNCRGITITFHG